MAPEWLTDELLASSKRETPLVDLAGPIPKGQRNSTLFCIARSIAPEFASQEALEAELQETNQDRCKPPLDKADVAKIAVTTTATTAVASAWRF